MAVDTVKRALYDFGRDAGLTRKSGAWYREGEGTIAVVHLQRSDYGPSYYVNLAFWLRELGDERYPRAWTCHVQARLGSLVPEESDRVRELFDLEQPMSDEDRMASISALLRSRVLPVIERGSSVAGLRAMLADGTLRHPAIMGPAQEVLASKED
jgi:hypothetical protein